MLLHPIATSAPKSKRKRARSTAIDKAVETFMKFQNEAEERFMRSEEDRWKREMEYEDRRRREEREHEIRIMQMLMQMNYPSHPAHTYEDLDYSEY